MQKRTTVFILVFLILALFLFSACDALRSRSDCETEEKKTIVYLGDSIAEAVAGPIPFNERESYGYYGIIGKINDYEFYNRAVSGSTTKNLLAYVNREDDGIQLVQSLLSTADIIHISIIGNDLLLTGRNSMLRSLARGDKTPLYDRRDTARENLDEILGRIRSLNPTATILLETLYNPVAEDSPLIPSFLRATLAENGYTPDRFHELMEIAVREMNSVLYDYIETNSTPENPIPVYTADVFSAMENLYETDRERWSRLIIEDGIHPSNEGHALIAEVTQAKLVELGLNGKNATERYKTIRKEQLERLYPNLETKNEIRSEIDKAKTMEEIARAYFDGTREEKPKNENVLTYSGKHFSENKVFTFDKLTILDYDLTAFLNSNRSYIRFLSDGKFEMVGELDSNVLRLLKAAIDGKAPFDLEEYADVDQLTPYLENIFPGEDHRDLKTLLEVFERAYGISVEGIQYESEAFETLAESFRQTGKIVIPSAAILGDKVRLRYSGEYRIVPVTHPISKEVMTAIYLNDAINAGEPYMKYTLSENENGDQTLRLIVDVLKFEVEATIRK